MRFKLFLEANTSKAFIPINYQYPLSSAIYRILSKGDADYASFLHTTGYGKGFKFFTFSQLNVPFKIEGDRLRMLTSEASVQIAFHLPQAAEHFVKGLFQSEEVVIADKKSKVSFSVKSVESLPNSLQQYTENELVNIQLKPLSPIVAGIPNERGNDDYLDPSDPRFVENLIYNWRSKIKACYDDATGDAALLMMEIIPMNKPFKSRLITIKEGKINNGKPEQTQIRGWSFFFLKVTAEKRFVELLLNSGCGIHSSQGCGMMEAVGDK